jgi:hypothetical protein
MTFQPILPLGGLAGWSLLQRTKDAQMDSFSSVPEQERRSEYFLENISKVETAQQLVEDRQLLQVALGAFGLSDDLDNRYFIQKILEGGTTDSDALANQMTDSRYQSLAEAFAFDRSSGPATLESGFVEMITSLFTERSFEEAVGVQDETLRLSLNAQRELADLASDSMSDNAKWYRVMGSAPLREVFETALGLPSSFGELDIDKQLEVFREKALQLGGNSEISQFTEQDNVDSLVERYLLMSQLDSGLSMSSAQIAITLLQS